MAIQLAHIIPEWDDALEISKAQFYGDGSDRNLWGAIG